MRGLTIHSSRHRFAARLNSGVRPNMRQAVFVVFFSFIPFVAFGQQTLIGAYVYGHEVESFQACGAHKTYWLTAKGSISELLRAEANATRNEQEPYPALYVRMTGVKKPKDKSGGFAGAYDGIFHATKAHVISLQVPATCKIAGLTLHSSGSPSATR